MFGHEHVSSVLCWVMNMPPGPGGANVFLRGVPHVGLFWKSIEKALPELPFGETGLGE